MTRIIEFLILLFLFTLVVSYPSPEQLLEALKQNLKSIQDPRSLKFENDVSKNMLRTQLDNVPQSYQRHIVKRNVYVPKYVTQSSQAKTNNGYQDLLKQFKVYNNKAALPYQNEEVNEQFTNARQLLERVQETVNTPNEEYLTASTQYKQPHANLASVKSTNPNTQKWGNKQASPVIQIQKPILKVLKPATHKLSKGEQVILIQPSEISKSSNLKKPQASPSLKGLLETNKAKKRYLVIYPNGKIDHVDDITALTKNNKNYVLLNKDKITLDEQEKVITEKVPSASFSKLYPAGVASVPLLKTPSSETTIKKSLYKLEQQEAIAIQAKQQGNFNSLFNKAHQNNENNDSVMHSTATPTIFDQNSPVSQALSTYSKSEIVFKPKNEKENIQTELNENREIKQEISRPTKTQSVTTSPKPSVEIKNEEAAKVAYVSNINDDKMTSRTENYKTYKNSVILLSKTQNGEKADKTLKNSDNSSQVFDKTISKTNNDGTPLHRTTTKVILDSKKSSSETAIKKADINPTVQYVKTEKTFTYSENPVLSFDTSTPKLGNDNNAAQKDGADNNLADISNNLSSLLDTITEQTSNKKKTPQKEETEKQLTSSNDLSKVVDTDMTTTQKSYKSDNKITSINPLSPLDTQIKQTSGGQKIPLQEETENDLTHPENLSSKSDLSNSKTNGVEITLERKSNNDVSNIENTTPSLDTFSKQTVNDEVTSKLKKPDIELTRSVNASELDTTTTKRDDVKATISKKPDNKLTSSQNPSLFLDSITNQKSGEEYTLQKEGIGNDFIHPDNPLNNSNTSDSKLNEIGKGPEKEKSAKDTNTSENASLIFDYVTKRTKYETVPQNDKTGHKLTSFENPPIILDTVNTETGDEKPKQSEKPHNKNTENPSTMMNKVIKETSDVEQTKQKQEPDKYSTHPENLSMKSETTNSNIRDFVRAPEKQKSKLKTHDSENTTPIIDSVTTRTENDEQTTQNEETVNEKIKSKSPSVTLDTATTEKGNEKHSQFQNPSTLLETVTEQTNYEENTRQIQETATDSTHSENLSYKSDKSKPKVHDVKRMSEKNKSDKHTIDSKNTTPIFDTMIKRTKNEEITQKNKKIDQAPLDTATLATNDEKPTQSEKPDNKVTTPRNLSTLLDTVTEQTSNSKKLQPTKDTKKDGTHPESMSTNSDTLNSKFNNVEKAPQNDIIDTETNSENKKSILDTVNTRTENDVQTTQNENTKNELTSSESPSTTWDTVTQKPCTDEKIPQHLKTDNILKKTDNPLASDTTTTENHNEKMVQNKKTVNKITVEIPSTTTSDTLIENLDDDGIGPRKEQSDNNFSDTGTLSTTLNKHADRDLLSSKPSFDTVTKETYDKNNLQEENLTPVLDTLKMQENVGENTPLTDKTDKGRIVNVIKNTKDEKMPPKEISDRDLANNENSSTKSLDTFTTESGGEKTPPNENNDKYPKKLLPKSDTSSTKMENGINIMPNEKKYSVVEHPKKSSPSLDTVDSIKTNNKNMTPPNYTTTDKTLLSTEDEKKGDSRKTTRTQKTDEVLNNSKNTTPLTDSEVTKNYNSENNQQSEETSNGNLIPLNTKTQSKKQSSSDTNNAHNGRNTPKDETDKDIITPAGTSPEKVEDGDSENVNELKESMLDYVKILKNKNKNGPAETFSRENTDDNDAKAPSYTDFDKIMLHHDNQLKSESSTLSSETVSSGIFESNKKNPNINHDNFGSNDKQDGPKENNVEILDNKYTDGSGSTEYDSENSEEEEYSQKSSKKISSTEVITKFYKNESPNNEQFTSDTSASTENVSWKTSSEAVEKDSDTAFDNTNEEITELEKKQKPIGIFRMTDTSFWKDILGDNIMSVIYFFYSPSKSDTKDATKNESYHEVAEPVINHRREKSLLKLKEALQELDISSAGMEYLTDQGTQLHSSDVENESELMPDEKNKENAS